MKARKMRHSATVVNDKIYVTGGRFFNSHDSVEDSDSFDCWPNDRLVGVNGNTAIQAIWPWLSISGISLW